MAARTIYPAPECPNCGKSENLVKNTYYTVDGRILRTRLCSFCGQKWWSLQYPEVTMDTEKYKVVLPSKFTKGYSRKQVQIVNIND